MYRFEPEEFRKLTIQARKYLFDYEKSRAQELERLEEESEVAEQKRPFCDRFGFTMPSDHAELLAALVHHFSKPEKGEGFSGRVRRALKDRRIVEVGARYGAFIKFLNDEGARAEGIDPDYYAHQVAQSTGIPVHRIGYEDLIAAAGLDAVLSNSVTSPTAPHDIRFSEEEEMAKKIAGALKSGGVTAHVVYDERNAMRRKYLETAGLRIIHHGKVNGHIQIAMAYKP